MQIGDLVLFEKTRWQVESQHDNLFILRAWEGRTREVHPKDLGVKVLTHPPTRWPFCTAPVRVKDGPIVKLTIVRENKVWLFEPLIDWVPADRIRAGGAIFINPAAKLKIGEVLVVHYKSNRAARITITSSFGSVAQRQARAQPNKPAARPIYERLMDDDLFDDT